MYKPSNRTKKVCGQSSIGFRRKEDMSCVPPLLLTSLGTSATSASELGERVAMERQRQSGANIL